jgi:hypothetical protein
MATQIDGNKQIRDNSIPASKFSFAAASQAYVDTQIANLINSAPGALDTLKELSDALNGDANFASTITTALAGKLALAGGTMSGAINMGANLINNVATPVSNDDAATKLYVDNLVTGATLTQGDGIKITSGVIKVKTAANAGMIADSTGLYLDPATAMVLLASRQVFNETAGGAVDGTNATYTAANGYVTGTLQVYLNGLLQNEGAGNDYALSGADVVFVTAPVIGDRVAVSYIRS